MLRNIRTRVTYANVVATLALFIALATGGAYAANTIYSSDIVDGEVKSIDIEDGSTDPNLANKGIQTADLGLGSVNSPKIKDGAIKIQDLGPNDTDSSKVVDNSLTGADISDGSLTGADVNDNSLTAADINEELLSVDNCYDGAVLAWRLCARSDFVKRNAYDALDFCAAEGLRLPTFSEAISMAHWSNPPGVGQDDSFWTDEYSIDGTQSLFMVVARGGYWDTEVPTNLNATVCVETPTNLGPINAGL
jgi:hypothetical protein